jgi:hypothetical protein
MVLPQPVAQRRLGSGDVDLRTVEQLAQGRRSHHVAVGQPAHSLGLVRADDLLGDPVDVPERGVHDDLAGRERDLRVRLLPGDLGEGPVQHLLLTEPVCPDQRVRGDTPLRQPAGVLLGSRRRGDLTDLDVVAQDVCDGLEVALDACPEQLQDQPVALQLLDRLGQHLVQGPGQLRHLHAHRGRDLDHAGGGRLVRLVVRHGSLPSCAPILRPEVMTVSIRQRARPSVGPAARIGRRASCSEYSPSALAHS